MGVELVTGLFMTSTEKAVEFSEKFSHTVANYFNTTFTESFLQAISCVDTSGLARVAGLLIWLGELRSLCRPKRGHGRWRHRGIDHHQG